MWMPPTQNDRKNHKLNLRMKRFTLWLLFPSTLMIGVMTWIFITNALVFTRMTLRQRARFFDVGELNGPFANATSDLTINTLQDHYFIYLPAAPPPAHITMHQFSPKPEGYVGRTTTVIQLLLNHHREGFYVESVGNSVMGSNTHELEMDLGWIGIIMEIDPDRLALLVPSRHHVVISSSCLSLKPHPTLETFVRLHDTAPLTRPDGDDANETIAKHPNFVCQCFPLHSYMVALERSRIDYLSLDLAGRDVEALEHFPFDKVDVRTISIKVNPDIGEKYSSVEFLEGKGYTTWGWVPNSADPRSKDWIFYKAVKE